MTDSETYLDPEEAAAVWGGADEEPDWLYRIVAFDPGGTTGWCVMAIHEDAIDDPEIRIVDNVQFWTAGEFTGEEDDQADSILDLANSWPTARLIMEDFILRKFSKSEELLSPVRLAAIVRHGLRPRYFILQQSALAMTTVTDERMKSMGFWIPGKQHARGAVKHALTWAKRAKERATAARRKVS
jgi:hypothetical protein